MSETFAPRPGRPTRAQAAALAKALLAAAAEIFLAEGFEGTSMEAVAARAGVPRSTLYKRYPDKVELLRAVLRARVAAMSEVASQGDPDLPRELAARIKVRAIGMLAIATQPLARTFFRLAVSAWREDAEIPERLAVIGYTRMVDLIAEDVRDFGPQAGIRAEDPRRVAEAVMALLFGWLETKGAAGPHEARAFAEWAVDLVIRGQAVW